LRALAVHRAELSLSLVADEEMHDLNRTYRGKDRPTDVLAFPLHTPPIPDHVASLGDVVISIDTAALAAGERRRPLATCLDELVIHGILHLLGYDHDISPAEERRMARRAREVRAVIGVLAPPVVRATGRKTADRRATRRRPASDVPAPTRRAGR
jgi:rRNA maturation RNase YbeY